MDKIWIVGAGPGDPELITVRGKRLVEHADVIIYAGSLVNKEILDWKRDGCEVYDSASMTLDEVIGVIRAAVEKKKSVVRLHTGDPTIYGAIKEQIDALDTRGIQCEVIPGVSSFTAAAAALKKEFTLPGVSQTVICTRMGARTPVPEKESIESLAAHRASMAIFLSVGMIGELVKKLMAHYPASTPAAVVYKASWKDQKAVTGTLETIAGLVQQQDIHKTAQILVGDFLDTEYELSKLYDPSFAHGYRGCRK